MTKTEILSSWFVVEPGKTKTTTAVTAEILHHFDTDGWEAAGSGGVGPYGVPVETVAAPGSGQADCSMILKGKVLLQKDTSTAMVAGQGVKSGAGSKCVLWVPGADAQKLRAGIVAKDAATADTHVEVWLND